MADGIAKMMTSQEANFKKQEAFHLNKVFVLHKQVEKLNKDVAKLKAKSTDEKKDLECEVTALLQAKSIATQHIQELMQENQTLKAEIEGSIQHLPQTSQELLVSYENECGSLHVYM